MKTEVVWRTHNAKPDIYSVGFKQKVCVTLGQLRYEQDPQLE